MKKIFRILQLVILAMVLLSPALKADITKATIGGQDISIPAPNNYFQVYGKGSNFDEFIKNAVPPSNSLLAVYMDEVSLAEILKNELPQSGGMLFIEYNKQYTGDINRDKFNSLKQDIRGNIDSSFAKCHDAISQLLENASTAVGVKMNIQDPICLGTFGEDSNSIGFTILSKTEVNGNTGVGVVSCFYALVKNRVLYIYSSKSYNDKSDIQWTRDSLSKWKDAIMSAN